MYFIIAHICQRTNQLKKNKNLSKWQHNCKKKHLFTKKEDGMTDEKFFHSLIDKVNGLYLLLISDRDGVPLLRISMDYAQCRISQDKNADFALMPSFIPTFTTATDQAGKLGLGRNKTIISMYSNYQVVQMNKLPLILTFVGSENLNIGHILALENQIDAHLEDIKLAVCEA